MDTSLEVILFKNKGKKKDSYFLSDEILSAPDYPYHRKIMEKHKALLIIEGLKRFYNEKNEHDIDAYNEVLERDSLERIELHKKQEQKSAENSTKELYEKLCLKFDQSLIDNEKLDTEDIRGLSKFKKFYTSNDLIKDRKITSADETNLIFLRRKSKITFIGKHKDLEHLLEKYAGSFDKDKIITTANSPKYKFDDFTYKRVKVKKSANLFAEYLMKLKPVGNDHIPLNGIYKKIEDLRDRYKIPILEIKKLMKDNDIEIFEAFNKRYIRIDDFKKITSKLKISLI